ncbi:MAG: hemolysin family protein [Verrucomicrobiota bacterium]
MGQGTEIIVIFLLILANGIFAMAEIALVSARKSRLQKWVKDGDKRAAVALELTASPNRFLSTVQFGITLVGICAGAFGGVTLAKQIADWIRPLPYVGNYGESIGMTTVVLGITILSIIFGELVPKRIALNYPEKIALVMAKPMDALSRFFSPIVNVLSMVTDAALNLFGVKEKKESPVSEEELKILLSQGFMAGVLQKTEKEMMEGVLDLDRLTVDSIMTPQPNIVWLHANDPDELNWRKIVASGHSYFPVYEGQKENVLGMVSVKALWANLSLANKAEIRAVLTDPFFVPTSMTVIKLLENFKQMGRHVALVTNEFGDVEGLVSLQDVLESIVGEMPSREHVKKHRARQRSDGSWMVDAMLDIDEFKTKLEFKELPGEKDGEYQTVGGFIIHQLGKIPEEGDMFEFQGMKFEVLDKDRHKIDKILIMPMKKV